MCGHKNSLKNRFSGCHYVLDNFACVACTAELGVFSHIAAKEYHGAKEHHYRKQYCQEYFVGFFVPGITGAAVCFSHWGTSSSFLRRSFIASLSSVLRQASLSCRSRRSRLLLQLGIFCLVMVMLILSISISSLSGIQTPPQTENRISVM